MKPLHLRLLSLVVPIFLSACAGLSSAGPDRGEQAASASTADFRLKDFDWSRGSGTGAVQGVLRLQAGSSRYSCVGRDVVLLPETAWSRARVMTLYGSATMASTPVETVRGRSLPAPPGYDQIVRHAPCGGDDRFNFQNLPNGAWFVITAAQAVRGDAGPIVVMHRVETTGGPRRVVLGEGPPPKG